MPGVRQDQRQRVLHLIGSLWEGEGRNQLSAGGRSGGSKAWAEAQVNGGEDIHSAWDAVFAHPHPQASLQSTGVQPASPAKKGGPLKVQPQPAEEERRQRQRLLPRVRRGATAASRGCPAGARAAAAAEKEGTRRSFRRSRSQQRVCLHGGIQGVAWARMACASSSPIDLPRSLCCAGFAGGWGAAVPSLCPCPLNFLSSSSLKSDFSLSNMVP